VEIIVSREVRRVPANWQHPKNPDGTFVRLCSADRISDLMNAYIEEGWPSDIANSKASRDCMPTWSAAEATHFMLYESISEGTPLTPAFAEVEELAKWCSEHPKETGWDCSYDEWLKICKRGFAPSAMFYL
jgi:hypothetical protein